MHIYGQLLEQRLCFKAANLQLPHALAKPLKEVLLKEQSVGIYSVHQKKLC